MDKDKVVEAEWNTLM